MLPAHRDMKYTNTIRIADPGASLPPETLNLVGPFVNESEIQFRKLTADWTTPDHRLLDSLKQFADGVFRHLAPLELLKHSGDTAAFKKAVGVDGGVGEVALRYVHFIHRKAGRGRLPLFWHTGISDYLEGLAEQLESKWWQAQNGSSPSFDLETPPVGDSQPVAGPETTQPCRVQTETGVRISKFIQAVQEATGERITKTAIWQMAGYKSRTDFEHFQREDPKATVSARKQFNRILRMKPEEFIAEAKRRGIPKAH
jgi:hypothetical protein